MNDSIFQVDTFDVRICLAKTQRHIFDFEKIHETELHRIEIPLEFHILQSGNVHGLAFWFDVAFIGSGATVWLSTAPTEPLTHWYGPADITLGQCENWR